MFPEHYDGREQAFVKHKLLERYLEQWAYRVGREWEKLVYIDGFAGPWKVASDDYADSSFGVAAKTLKAAQAGLRTVHRRDVSIQLVLVGHTKKQRDELETFAARHRTPGFDIQAVQGEFAERIDDIEAIVAADRLKAFRFVFIDPKGWNQIPMEPLVEFLQSRGCEVLVNIMTSYIRRFLDEPDREASYRRLFGREGVVEQIRRFPLEQRAENVVLEYASSLREMCGFRYVSSMVVFEPTREDVRYYLVFATNHAKGIEVFKVAEMTAADLQNDVRVESKARKDGALELALDGDGCKTQHVLDVRQRFCDLARLNLLNHLASVGAGRVVPYSRLYCDAMFYPLVTPADLESWIASAGKGVEIMLSGERRKKLRPDEPGDGVVVTDVAAMRAALARR